MVTQIQLGNFFSANGRTVLGGVAGSGLDTEGLIEALTTAKRLPAVELEDKIELNTKKNEAITQFKTLLSKLQDASSFLRNPPGVGNAAENVFKFTKTDVLSNTAIPGSLYVNVTAAPGASQSSYTITDIASVAKAKQQKTAAISVATTFDAPAVSNTPAGGQFQAGTIVIRGEIIALEHGDTLDEVVGKFNAVSDETGISASIVKLGTGSYSVLFTATATGEDADFDLDVGDPTTVDSDPSGVLASVGITDAQQASNAEFTVNGITIIRQGNAISDAIDGLTFNLLQATPDDGTEIAVSVKADDQIVRNGIVNFVNAYNELKIFAAQQTEVGANGTFTDEAILADNASFRFLMGTVNSQLASMVSGISAGNPNRLADIGISFIDLPESDENPLVRNILNVDEGKLSAAIAGNFNGVRRVFEFDLVSDNPNLRVFSRTNALGVSDFTLNVNPFALQSTGAITVADADTAIVTAVPAAGEIGAGTITLRGTNIDLTVGMTLNQIAQAFNDETGTTGVTAAVVDLGGGQFRLDFTSTISSGQANFDLAHDDVNPDDLFAQVGGTSATGSFQATYDLGEGPVTVDVNATLIAGGGYSIAGTAGTALEGLVMIYGSTLASAMEVTTTQGIADQVFNTASTALKTDTGSIEIELETLKVSDQRLTVEIARIDEQVARFREQLLAKFTALEQALSRINTLLSALDAQDKARLAASS